MCGRGDGPRPDPGDGAREAIGLGQGAWSVMTLGEYERSGLGERDLGLVAMVFGE